MDYIDAKMTENVMTRLAGELIGKVIDGHEKDELAHSLKDLGLLREKGKATVLNQQ